MNKHPLYRANDDAVLREMHRAQRNARLIHAAMLAGIGAGLAAFAVSVLA
jgi:hypothetical protein